MWLAAGTAPLLTLAPPPPHHVLPYDPAPPLPPAPHPLPLLPLQWTDPMELHGIGQYGSDAYWMFCRGRWRETEPADKDLRRYREWLMTTGGRAELVTAAVCTRGLGGFGPLGLGRTCRPALG